MSGTVLIEKKSRFFSEFKYIRSGFHIDTFVLHLIFEIGKKWTICVTITNPYFVHNPIELNAVLPIL